ncbi:hypothetical protein NLG97_g11079 [Lecanicillium saksenae]|uniref:Uncharacterized protein n=1 Tax=Lecanicillium saksenae TaxID=468837 RepID=A0ACC1QBF0_9HYPO|nr:hypothetical protein NLG97_g11079 [Lecanicillium saksenae]
MFGYSGGAGVIYDTVRTQPGYAPELKIAGGALGGTRSRGSVDPVLVFTFANKSPRAGLIPILLQLFASQSPEFDTILRQQLKPKCSEHFYNPNTQCLEANYDAFRNQGIFSMFHSTGFISRAAEYAKGLEVTDVAPQIPLYWLQLEKDELAPVTDTSETISDLCSRGSQIEYEIETNKKFRHASYAMISVSHAFRWLDKVMSGSGADHGCTTKEVFTDRLDRDFLDTFSDKIQGFLKLTINGQPL